MKRTLALLLMLPPLAVLPVSFMVAVIGNWSASSIAFVVGEAMFLSTIALPLALAVQCTYGLMCFLLLRRPHLLNVWTCLLAGGLPFVVMKLTGYIDEQSVTLVVGAFGIAIALASWGVLWARGVLG